MKYEYSKRNKTFLVGQGAFCVAYRGKVFSTFLKRFVIHIQIIKKQSLMYIHDHKRHLYAGRPHLGQISPKGGRHLLVLLQLNDKELNVHRASVFAQWRGTCDHVSTSGSFSILCFLSKKNIKKAAPLWVFYGIYIYMCVYICI